MVKDQNEILQENMRSTACLKLYKIYMLLHRSDLNISEICRQLFSAFFGKILHILQH